MDETTADNSTARTRRGLIGSLVAAGAAGAAVGFLGAIAAGVLVAAIFAFFVVMYAISSVNEGKYRVLSSAIVDAFRSGSTISVNTTPPSGGVPGSRLQE